MSKYDQSNSDPLPFVQVDRSAKPKAAMLADVLGVSRQHAMGSLVDWWDLCGDPRELERIVEHTTPGLEPEVVLTKEDAALRFKLASTREVEPLVLARIGLLEEREDGRFRVRGMSRYFDAIRGRINARKVAASGGKASAESRKQRYGTAQPRSGASSEVGSESVRTTPELPPNRRRTDSRTDAEPTPEAPPKRDRTLEVRGQRSDVKALPPAAPVAAPKVTREITDALCADFTDVTGQRYLWSGEKDSAGLKALLGVATLEEVRSRWRRGLAAPADEWASCRTVAQLRSKWNDLADAKAAPRLSIEHQPSRIL